MHAPPFLSRAACPPASCSRLRTLQSDRDSKEDLAKVFRLFDVDGRGYITIRELSKVAKELQESLTGAWPRGGWQPAPS